MRRRQLATLRAVGEAVAAILRTLRGLGVADDALVIFTSDDGCAWGEHRIVAKSRPYEEQIRVPYLVRCPRLVPLARRDARLVTNLDFVPTFLELAGASVPPAVAGASLVPLLDGTARTWRSEFIAEAWPDGLECVTLREARWKLTEYRGGRREPHDLEADPFELENLAGDPALLGRLALFGLRIRAIRPGWPDDLPPLAP